MKTKLSLFFIFIVFLCGCSTPTSQPSSSSSSFSNVVSNEPVSTNSNKDESLYSYSSIERPYINDFNEEDYKPFNYNGFVLKYDDANNSYIVCDYQGVEGSDVCVEIPEYCNGLPITEIAPYAFKDKHIKELVISKNINKLYPTSLPNSSLNLTIRVSDENPYFVINNHCLFNREQTELIMMIDKYYPLSVPKTVKEIKEDVWDISLVTTMNLSLIYVEDGNECFASVNGVLFDKKMTKLIHVPCCFSGDLIIPKTIKEIDLNLLENRNYFENIIVEEGNPYFSSKDGILYKGNFEELIYQPARNQTTKLVLPNTVKAISWRLRNIVEIILNDNIENIVSSAFAYCHSVNSTIFNGCEYIGSDSNKFLCLYKIPYELEKNAGIGSIIVHNSCKFICDASPALKTQSNPYLYADETGVYSEDKKTVYTFYINTGANPLISLLPEAEKLRDDYDNEPITLAVSWSTKIPIKVGKNFKDLDRLLATVKNIGSVEFYDDSNYYLIENGMLLNKEKTVLYRYNGQSKAVVIPHTVKKIIAFAFWGTDVNKVVLNDFLEEIGDEAFSRLSGITEISFPDSLISIGKLAFYNCRLSIIRLGKNIKFIGTCAFANDNNDTEEIFLSSTNACIEKFAFSRYKDAIKQHNVIVHLAFDNSINNIKNWNSLWCGRYKGVEDYPPEFYDGSTYVPYPFYDSGYLLDWNYIS